MFAERYPSAIIVFNGMRAEAAGCVGLSGAWRDGLQIARRHGLCVAASRDVAWRFEGNHTI